MALWSGRFTDGTSAAMQAFSSSLDTDLQMWREDLEGSMAHAQMLGEVGIITEEESRALIAGLQQVGAELASGAFVPTAADEDVHLAVERRLTELAGPVGQKLHTARSRNDQVATDVRLWLVRRLRLLDEALSELLRALLDRVESDGDVLFPGYTHLQRGQPIFFGHHLLAHAWMIHRDLGRVRDAVARMDECPLGAAALAGTPHPIDRARTAALLGFARPVPNAMDAVSARDHALEAAAACAIAATHLSRQAEELVLWSTEEFGFVRLSDGFATGSSIMPQKRNPDAAELVRGKSGRVIGDLVALLTLVKGLPLAYDRDLQEDRPALFDAVNTTTACASVLAGAWSTASFARDRFDLRGSFALATEIADWLATRGVPFREAHHLSGRIVASCEERGIDLGGLTEAEWAGFHPSLAGVGAWLDPAGAADRRASLGGTARVEIARQLAALRGSHPA
ncbi:MAG: argininosuccinate lyase [Myxococcota bacterium]